MPYKLLAVELLCTSQLLLDLLRSGPLLEQL